MRKNKKINIIYKDDQIVVCEKPKGIPVSSDKTGDMDLLHQLKNQLFFEENKKNLNLYQLSILIILLITSIQIGSNSIKYAQLNDYISNNSYKQNPQEEVVNDLQDENSHTQQSNINLSKLKEVSSIIGEEKIQSIDLNSNVIEMQGYCKNIKILPV